MCAALVNGVAAVADQAIDVADRGLNYGDGLFETMLLADGAIRFLDSHLERLALGCDTLRIRYPGSDLLRNEIAAIVGLRREAVVKLVITRGRGGRGYRPNPGGDPTRIITLHESPSTQSEIRVRWCRTRLARNPVLAGIKHLNRLEQVLAQQEWDDASITEGLMLDVEGELVCATAANVFLVKTGVLLTPHLRHCGVRGIMRGNVIRAAKQLGIEIREQALHSDDVVTADEIFVTNAVRGVRPVIALDERTWRPGSVTAAICRAVATHA